MLHAVIMAGGSGTRFWPASRRAQPKQLLDLVGGQTMIQATVRRLGPLAPAERVLVVTNDRLVSAVREQLPELPAESVIGEPCKRDTAPCVGLAAMLVSRDDPDATMAVMPADHVIGPDATFQQAIRHAADLVERQPERIVTFGIRPTYPAETFGYIERSAPLSETADAAPATYRVAQFREKPSAEVAAQYIAAGSFYWNAGIFVWKARRILEELAEREPAMCARLRTIAAAVGTPGFDACLAAEFPQIEPKSIDYAVMEHAREIAVVEAPFQWDDVGNWQSLARQQGQDSAGNTLIGRHVGLNTRGTIVRTDQDHLVVTVGLEDMIVVHTPDATLVARKDQEEALRDVVKELEQRGWEEFL